MGLEKFNPLAGTATQNTSAANHQNNVWFISLSLWIAVLIASPISLWIFGRDVFPLVASAGVIAQVVTVWLSLIKRWHISRIIRVMLVIGTLSWMAEFAGHSTGIPFGQYHYTPALQPQILGVPALIPFAWMMMLLPAWGITDTLLQPLKDRLRQWYPVVFSIVSGLAITAWDLYLDPQMVSFNLWEWDIPGAYFGIPLINYAGWWLTATVITIVTRPSNLPAGRLTTIYVITWIMQGIGLGVFWGQPGPALVGFLGMGVFIFTMVVTRSKS